MMIRRTFSWRRSSMAAMCASLFSLFISILCSSFSLAILMKLLCSSMAFWATSRSCSLFSARCLRSSASWHWRVERDGRAIWDKGICAESILHMLQAYAPHLSSLLGCVQFLLDLFQRGVPAGREGRLKFPLSIEGWWSEDDLEGLAWGSLVQLNDLHVFNDAQVEVHNICEVRRIGVTFYL